MKCQQIIKTITAIIHLKNYFFYQTIFVLKDKEGLIFKELNRTIKCQFNDNVTQISN